MLADFYQVLIVHPDPLLRFSAAQWLRARAIRSTLVGTPAEAIHVLRQRPIDLVAVTLSDTDTGWFNFAHTIAAMPHAPAVAVGSDLTLPSWLTPGIQPHVVARVRPPADYVELARLVDTTLELRLVA